MLRPVMPLPELSSRLQKAWRGVVGDGAPPPSSGGDTSTSMSGVGSDARTLCGGGGMVGRRDTGPRIPLTALVTSLVYAQTAAACVVGEAAVPSAAVIMRDRRVWWEAAALDDGGAAVGGAAAAAATAPSPGLPQTIALPADDAIAAPADASGATPPWSASRSAAHYRLWMNLPTADMGARSDGGTALWHQSALLRSMW